MDADVEAAIQNLVQATQDHDAKLGMLKDAVDGLSGQMAVLEARLAHVEAKLAVPAPAAPIVIAPVWNHPPMPWGPPRPWGFGR